MEYYEQEGPRAGSQLAPHQQPSKPLKFTGRNTPQAQSPTSQNTTKRSSGGKQPLNKKISLAKIEQQAPQAKGVQGPYLNTQSFEKLLLRGVEVQNQMANPKGCLTYEDVTAFPKLRKSCRSYKEVAETSIEQMSYLFSKGYINANRMGQVRAASQDTRNEGDLMQYQLLVQERDQLIYNLRQENSNLIQQVEQRNPGEKPNLCTDFEQNNGVVIQRLSGQVRDLEKLISGKDQTIQKLNHELMSEMRNHSNSQPTSGADRNLELQARMIEDLIQKNETEGPSLMKTPTSQHAKMIFQMTPDKHLATVGGTDDNDELMKDPNFGNFVNLKLIEYIKDQFSSKKNSSQATIDAKNVSFNELSNVVDELVLRLYYVFVIAQAQSVKLKTFEETMVQLDEVFTRSAVDGNDSANLAVAQELRLMNHSHMTQAFELQSEMAQLKAVKNLPTELIKVLRRGYARNKNSLLNCFDLGGVEGTDNNRRARSRPRTEKRNRKQSNERSNPSGFPACGLENIGCTLERMQELDDTNSVLTLEIHNLKTELLSSQDTIKQKESEMDRLREEIGLCQQNFKSAEDQIKEAQDKYERKINSLQKDVVELKQKHQGESADQCEKNEKMVHLNEELRTLFEQEREEQACEMKKIACLEEQTQRQADRQMQVIRSKLLILLSAFHIGGQFAEFDRETISVDELFRMLQSVANQRQQLQAPHLNQHMGLHPVDVLQATPDKYSANKYSPVIPNNQGEQRFDYETASEGSPVQDARQPRFAQKKAYSPRELSMEPAPILQYNYQTAGQRPTSNDRYPRNPSREREPKAQYYQKQSEYRTTEKEETGFQDDNKMKYESNFNGRLDAEESQEDFYQANNDQKQYSRNSSSPCTSYQHQRIAEGVETRSRPVYKNADQSSHSRETYQRQTRPIAYQADRKQQGSIDEILSSFHTQKSQFNQKLAQLKNKLDRLNLSPERQQNNQWNEQIHAQQVDLLNGNEKYVASPRRHISPLRKDIKR